MPIYNEETEKWEVSTERQNRTPVVEPISVHCQDLSDEQAAQLFEAFYQAGFGVDEIPKCVMFPLPRSWFYYSHDNFDSFRINSSGNTYFGGPTGYEISFEEAMIRLNSWKKEGDMTVEQQRQNQQTEEVKNLVKKIKKSRQSSRLIFTYTNGKTYTVRGVEHWYITNDPDYSRQYLCYSAKTETNDGFIKEQTISVPLTNQLVNVAAEVPTSQENGDVVVESKVVLDLQPIETVKVSSQRPHACSKEDYLAALKQHLED